MSPSLYFASGVFAERILCERCAHGICVIVIADSYEGSEERNHVFGICSY